MADKSPSDQPSARNSWRAIWYPATVVSVMAVAGIVIALLFTPDDVQSKPRNTADAKRTDEDAAQHGSVQSLSADEWFDKGQALWDGSKYDPADRAVKYFTKVIDLEPNNAIAYRRRGIAYYDLKKYQRAIEDYDKAIELDPKYAKAYSNRGVAYYAQKKFRRAIQDFDKATALNPDSAVTYYNRGNAYYYLKKYQRAVQDYDKAIDLDPNDADMYYNRGMSLENLYEQDKACRNWRKACDLGLERACGYKYIVC